MRVVRVIRIIKVTTRIIRVVRVSRGYYDLELCYIITNCGTGDNLYG